MQRHHVAICSSGQIHVLVGGRSSIVHILTKPKICHAHRVDSRQQELGNAGQDLGHRHLIAEQQVSEVRPLHALLQVHLVLDLIHFFLHQLFSYETRGKRNDHSRFLVMQENTGATLFVQQVAAQTRCVGGSADMNSNKGSRSGELDFETV